LLLVSKVPVVPAQLADPSVPALGPLVHVKIPATPPLTLKVVKLPGVVSEAFTVLVLDVALTPEEAGQALMAAARLVAKSVKPAVEPPAVPEGAVA
jgi:hypothetical protein